MSELHQYVSGSGQAVQAGRDVHIHHGDGVRRTASPATTGECPYPGLAAFTTEQAGWFFGRDRLTAYLVGRVVDRLAEGRPVLVVGPSGAGKSSLLRAGLLAAIRDRGVLPHDWPRVVVTPMSPMPPVTGPAVVVVDQLEELLCADTTEFLDTLTALAATGSAVVLGLRIDAYARCLDHPMLREAAQNGQVVVGAMTEAELRQAVTCPSQEAGLELESGLVDVLLRDLGVTSEGYEPGRLPLLAHVLRSLWWERHGHLLTLVGYETTGGVADAVATTAELAYTHLADPGRRAARALFLRLVRVGADPAADTRHAVPCADLPAVLGTFVAARLLTQDRDRVTITHEVLLRAWPRLRGWLAEDRADHLTRQQLEDAASAWVADRDSSSLLRGTRLESARTWVSTSNDELTPTGAAFYTASVRQDTRTRRKRRLLVAILAALALIASVTAGTALYQRHSAQLALKQIIATQLVTEAQQMRSADTETSRNLAAQLDLVALRLREETGTDDPAVDTGLTIDTSRLITVSTDHLSDARFFPDIELVFSPDSRTLAITVTGDADEFGHASGFVEFWDVSDWRTARKLSYRITVDASITSTQFSPNGDLLAVGAADGTVRLWRFDPTAPPHQVGAVDDDVEMAPEYLTQTVAFLDATTLVVGWYAPDQSQGLTFATTVWDISRPTAPRRLCSILTADGGNTHLVGVVPARRLVLTNPTVGYGDGQRILLWHLADPAFPTEEGFLPSWGAISPERQISVAPDGTALVMSSGMGTKAELWDITRLSQPRRTGSLPDMADNQWVMYRPDGAVIATYYAPDHVIRLWQVASPAKPRMIDQPLVGHDAGVEAVAYSPDGQLLASAGYLAAGFGTPRQGGEVRLWNFDLDQNVRLLCDNTVRITEEQWRRLVPGLNYQPLCS